MTNNVLSRIKPPAIGLLIAGILNALTGIYMPVSALIQWKMGAFDRAFISDAEKTGFYAGYFGSTALGIISLLIAPVIIYGAVQMMNGKKYGLAKTAAILAVIPFVSCCFLIGIPFGIWALVVLSKPDVKAFFQNGSGEPGFQTPPMPPQQR